MTLAIKRLVTENKLNSDASKEMDKIINFNINRNTWSGLKRETNIRTGATSLGANSNKSSSSISKKSNVKSQHSISKLPLMNLRSGSDSNVIAENLDESLKYDQEELNAILERKLEEKD